MSNEIEEQENLKNPKVKMNKPVSFVWVLPLIIFGILSWVAYESYKKKGVNIEVIFKSAEGLKENATPLEYKGLQLGKVTDIKLHDDLKSVKVNILVKSDVAKYVASESSRFYIKRPTISLTKVSGLNTLISGYKIEVSPKFRTKQEFEKGKEKFVFKGLDSKPDDELATDGYYIKVAANENDSIHVGTPIFYKHFQIGEVASKEFKQEGVLLNLYIYDKFNYLVNESSEFIINSALKVDYGPSGLKVKVGSIYSAIVGGITVTTKDKSASKIDKNQVRKLYNSKDDLRKKEYFTINFDNATGIDKNTPIFYKGIKVGSIKKLKLTKDYVKAKGFLYKKYSHMLTQNSSFYIQKPEISLEDTKNIGNIIRGNFISIDYNSGKKSNSFYSKGFKKKELYKNSIKLTLYVNDLKSITKKSKIFYRSIPIGKVIDYDFNSNYKKVKINIAIEKKYEKLINNHTLFYDMSSKLLSIKNLDMNINYNGLKPLLNGAIGILTEKRDQKLTKNSFKLFEEYKKVRNLKRVYNQGSLYEAYFDNSFSIKKDMAIVFKNKEIGFVKSIAFDEKESKAKLFIYKEFQKYMNKTSAFYKKSKIDLEAGFDGVKFNMDNFTSLFEGSIHLKNKTDKIYKLKKIYSSYDELKSSSNRISILFDNVEGLKENSSLLTYKGVKVGKVTKIKLTSNQNVKVDAQIFNDYKKFAKQGVIYYLKKPVISLEEVSNLGSTLMPVNIGIIKTKSKNSFENSFKGYDSEPNLDKSEDGTTFKVESIHASKANINAPIYYKFVQIGKVHKKDLSKDGSKVIMYCKIEDKYAHLIRKNSKFYDISGFSASFSIFSESYVESNTFNSILKGGLVVVTPEDYKQKASSFDTFELIEKLPKNWDKVTPNIN
ncbi:MAG: MlaD family protein [Campylobacterota bacterium]